MPHTRVYQDTTIPLHEDKTPVEKVTITEGLGKEATKKPKKPPRRDKSDLGDNFIAPDGGWAWLVCIAAGVSNLSVYPCLQQFGFLFRERLTMLGLTNSEMTTIINTQNAVSSCTGLLNGPMFRRFTFRQVALAGALIIFAGLMVTAFCATFLQYLTAYSLMFGFGTGISVSASSLAINTYFKNKRRRAAGFSWTITGLGPIVLPYVVTFLLPIYGVQGTVMIFAALSLHAMVSAMIYQPVRLHAPTPPEAATTDQPLEEPLDYMCKFCELQQKKETGIFSSQYLYKEDDEDRPGYEIIEPGTPMLSRANDGWYGSRLSLASSCKPRFRSVSSSKDLEASVPLKDTIAEEDPESGEFFKPNNFKREHDEVLKQQFYRLRPGRIDSQQHLRCTCSEERALLQIQANGINNNQKSSADADKTSSSSSLNFAQKCVVFFDLDLLRDITYVNLVAGLTIINFGELNFSILTPFILNDFGFSTSESTLAIAVLGGLDITVRFLVPFFTEKISWDNRVFYMIGVVGIALGRTVVACTRSFTVILVAFAWIGMCKGIRTIFWPLIIPSYVPLKRLPAASGLQLLITGLFTLAAGPFVGLVRDRFDYSVTLHCLNAMSFIAAISWSSEALIRRYYRHKKSKN